MLPGEATRSGRTALTWMPLIFAGVVALSCLLIALAGVVALMVVPFVLVVGVGLIVRHLLRRGGRSSPP